MPLVLSPITLADQKVKMLVFGDPGVGKTTFAASAARVPEMSPVLILNLEGGLLSVADVPGLVKVDILTSADMDEAYFSLRNRNNGFESFQTIVIDSGTELANQTLAEWVLRNKVRAEKRGRGDADRTIDDVQLEDYGKLTAQLRRVFSWYRDLPLHVIVTGLAKREFAPNADQRLSAPLDTRPSFTDKLGTSVMGMMDHVWYMYRAADEDGEMQRYCLTSATAGYMAKTRRPVGALPLPNPLPDPTFTELYYELIAPAHADAGAVPIG